MRLAVWIIVGAGVGFGLGMAGINILDNPIKFLAIDIGLIVLFGLLLHAVWPD